MVFKLFLGFIATILLFNGIDAWCNGQSSTFLDLSPYKDEILKEHNTYRNLIASGGHSKYPSATRMVEMKYDEDLTKNAIALVKTSRIAHDGQKTKRFPRAGQNLGSYCTTEKITDYGKIVKDRIFSWYNESSKASVNNIRNVCCGDGTGHFTVMVNEKSSHCGCAAILYKNDIYNCMDVVCNYAYTNFCNDPAYKEGPPASECENQSPTYPNLCYNPDP